MKKLTAFVAAFALSSAFVAPVSAQTITTQGPVEALSVSTQATLAGLLGGLSAGAVVTIVVVGALLVVTITQGSETTTTTIPA